MVWWSGGRQGVLRRRELPPRATAGAPVSRPHMTLKVMRAVNASIPQAMGAAKSTAQKKLLSDGWMNRCSCARERDTHTRIARRGGAATASVNGGRGAAACLEALESPVVLSRFVHVVPPPEADEQPP